MVLGSKVNSDCYNIDSDTLCPDKMFSLISITHQSGSIEGTHDIVLFVLVSYTDCMTKKFFYK